MDANQIKQRMYESFGFTPEALAKQAKQTEQPAVMPQPKDYYQEMRSKASNSLSKPLLNGSTQKLSCEAKNAVQSLLGPFNKATDDSERLDAVGDKERARIVRQQYMEEVFLPVVESLVMMNSPEELLNSTNALKELDKYALVEGGRGSGYTAAFVRTLHKEDFGNVLPTSDVNVEDGVRRIRELVAYGSIRNAVGVAKRLKGQVDKGEFTASPEDYDLLQRVALR